MCFFQKTSVDLKKVNGGNMATGQHPLQQLSADEERRTKATQSIDLLQGIHIIDSGYT